MSKSKLHARFKTVETKEEEGVWTQFGDGIEVKIRRFKSRAVQDYQKKLNRPYADMVRRGPLPAHIAEDLMEKLIAHAVISDWRGVTNEDGTELPPTDENKLAIIKELPEFRDEILGVSFERDGFKQALDEDAEKN